MRHWKTLGLAMGSFFLFLAQYPSEASMREAFDFSSHLWLYFELGLAGMEAKVKPSPIPLRL